MLVTYSQLLDSLLAPPPTASATAPPEWQKQVEWITVLAQNIMAAANDLRPVQARGNLELMMQRQLELRKEETKAIHTCVSSHIELVKRYPMPIPGNVTSWKRDSPPCAEQYRNIKRRPLQPKPFNRVSLR